jgi:hypothetical protein
MKPDALELVRTQSRALVSAIRARDNAIRAASSSGSSIRAIAGAAGLSPARIHQILHGR